MSPSYHSKFTFLVASRPFLLKTGLAYLKQR